MGFTVRIKLSTAVAPKLSVAVKTTLTVPQRWASGCSVMFRDEPPEKVAKTLSSGRMVLSELVQVREGWRARFPGRTPW